MLRIRVAHAAEVARRESLILLDAVKHPVVSEDVDDAAELAREGLGIAEERPALRRSSDVRDDERAPDLLALQEREAGAVTRRSGLADHERVALLRERDPPAVAMPVHLAVACELVERETNSRWKLRRHRE